MRSDYLAVAFLPVYHNPYQHLLTDELEKVGVRVEHLTGMPSARWLVKRRDSLQILHLHWLYGLYMNRYLTPITWLSFLTKFAFAQRLGYRIVWTAHNILPHRTPFPPIHLAVRRLVMQQADAVIAHCQYARRELLCRFPREGPIHLIAHGNYRGAHTLTIPEDEARHALGIDPDAFVYGLVGNISPYKGIDRFIDAFQQHATPHDVALIAGRDRAPDLVARLEALAERDPRFRVHPGFISEDEMQTFLLASDVMVFCFDEVLTSGSVILGMTYGQPIIAPALGCLPELVSPDAGILYDPEDPRALGRSMQQIKDKDLHAMGAEARAIADELRWDKIARRTAWVYQQCLPSGL